MKIKVFKILTILSFLVITFSGRHLGGQFGLFIVVGLFSDIYLAIPSTVLLIVLLLFLLSAFNIFKSRELYIFIFGGILMSIPIVIHIRFILIHMKNSGDPVFYLTMIPFLLFYGVTLFMIIQENKSAGMLLNT